jgi:hypothetical protein
MASTWSSLKIQLMGAGDESGTWGTVTNANLGTVIEEAITGSANVSFSSADVTLTLTDSTASQTARNLRLNLTGTSGGARNLIVPAIEKFYIVNNGLADTVTVKNSTGTGVDVPAGKTMLVFNNGTNVLDVTTHLSSLTLGSALPASSGGTGLTSPGTAGNVLVSNGSAWTSGSGFPAGGIIMWSGTIATIPSGWALCNGANGTPDLRDRFIVGAGNSYAVGATGGSANAIVVSHTHTASTNTTGTHTHYIMEGAGYSYSYASTGVPDQSLSNGLNDGGASSYLMSGPNTTTGQPKANMGLTSNNGSHSHTVTVDSTGSSGTNANLPPYYALAYIMKL